MPAENSNASLPGSSDPSHDFLRSPHSSLDPLFAPKSVAVIGATETPNSVGRTVLWNLISSPFNGTVFPVNPKRPSILGIKAYPSILELPEKPDLAVVVTPAASVPKIIHDAASINVPAAIIISAGFKETGAPGVELERQVLAEARKTGMRIVGPNCLGILCPTSGLNASFAATMAKPGTVAFLSQSGALATAVLDWSFQEMVGFSVFASIGSMLDVGWGDLIDYLGDDPRTNSIVIYMESVGNARVFLSAAREVALTKPIIVIKAGRTPAAAKAAASHTGSLTGSDEVLDAAFRRCGVLRVNSISDVFNVADILGKQPRPAGPKLTILTNAGGPGVLATDALIQSGGELANISAPTIDALNQILPPQWSHNNPIDVLGDAPPDRYAKALEIAAQDPSSDGLLVILTPQSMTEPTQTADVLKKYAKIDGKPVLASWMGGPLVRAGQDILARAQIPTYSHPDEAARAFTYMWKYASNLKTLYETPALPHGSDVQPRRDEAAKILHTARAQSRTLLTELESKQLLAAYGIPTVSTQLAPTEPQAVLAANQIGYPVVLKLNSQTITHKTDVGGVILNLPNAEAVKKAFNTIKDNVSQKAGPEHFQGVTVQPMLSLDAYEIILGSSLDPQFGPILLFGSGGQLVEVYKDRALGLPPLNVTLARRMIEQTKIYKALQGVRGRPPVDLAQLEGILVRFSQLVVEQPFIREIDVNPLLCSPERIIALDGRVLLHESQSAMEQAAPPAIRPYPTKYVHEFHAADNTRLTLRPIRPEDEPAIVQFHQGLSERSVRNRYFQPLKLTQRTAHERLTKVCFNDYDRELALVAQLPDGQIIGVGRLSKYPGHPHAEFALIIIDTHQKKGIGAELLRLLIQIAKDEKIQRLAAIILPENLEMQKLCERVGFKLSRSENQIHAEMNF